jgi:hypothetical protein
MLDFIGSSNDWSHYIPFASLVVGKPVPENRPAMTRIIEQSFVGVVAAAVGSYATLQVHSKEIDTLKAQRVEAEIRTAKAVADSEIRLTAQIAEVRSVLLKHKD